MNCALEVTNLTVGWDTPLIENISLTLPPATTLAVVGQSGCGKSTLLSTLAGIKAPLAGSVKWLAEGRNVEPRRAMVWQGLALLPWKTVRQNLALPLVLSHEHDIDNKVDAMLEEMELAALAERYPQSLSGGQRQRLALGRAFISSPDVLFMDEPFSALDAILKERLQDLLKKIWRTRRCGIIFVTHDIAEAAFLGQRIMLLGANPPRVAALADNPAFCETERDVREGDEFYRVQKSLHAALSAVREGRKIEFSSEGVW